MPDRFYAPQPLDVPEIELEGPEAHHMSRVLRLGPGDEVLLFDGTGGQADAVILAVGKRSVRLVIRNQTCDAAPTPPITLAVAPPKGDRFRWLVEKATELGVDRLLPLETTRTVVEPGAAKLDKLRQTVIAACKQCGRTRLMEVGAPVDWEVLLDQEFPGRDVLIADPAGEPILCIEAPALKRPVLLVVGPEGGLTNDEIAVARSSGAWIASLGPLILRVETAAIALAAQVVLRRSSRP